MYPEIFHLHANFLKALAHPKRLEIVHLLRDQELSVSQIHTMLDLPQANISQHLTVLRDTHIVCCRREGKQIYYKLCDPKIIQSSDLLRQVLVEQYQNTSLAPALSLPLQDLIPLVSDPVCAMRISPKTAGFHTQHEGKEYFFCASGCLAAFLKKPEQYV